MTDVLLRKQLFLKRRATANTPKSTRFYLEAYLNNIDKPPILREAYAINAFLKNIGIRVHSDELITGAIEANEPVGFHYGCGTWVNKDSAQADLVRLHCYKYIDPRVFTNEEIKSVNAHASTSTWFGGHNVLDYERILEIGLAGYQEEISRIKNNNFRKAMELTLDGITAFILRLANKAYGEIAHNLHFIAKKPPVTLHQALQLIWVLHLLDNTDSFGRFDYYLLPFFEKEADRNRSKVLLADFWLKIEEANDIQNMTIGGTYSDLTLLCLEVTKELGLKGPNLCLRVTSGIPTEIWNVALDCIASGIGLPALYNDEIYTENLLNFNVPKQDAQNYCFGGCSQVLIPGQSNFNNDIGMMNIAKTFEMTMYGGFDPKSGTQAGIKTDTDFYTFKDFKDAFYAQLEYACEIQASIHNKEIPYRGLVEGYAIRTLFTRGCLEKEKGFLEGGANYNNVQLELIGITNAADSLYAIKKAVFDDRKLSFAELVNILRTNWNGYEDLRNYFYALPKFGNGYEEVDNLRVEITDFLYTRLNKEPGPFGGVYVPGEVIFTAHDHCGQATGATPDGRYAGDVLADSAGAARGCAVEGPTALMNSVLKLPVKGKLLTSTVLNMRFLPRTIRNTRTRKGVSALIKGFFSQGGMQLQINVCDSNLLKDAQKNPEQYPDLIVRVGGYSDYFIRLSKNLQDEIIDRTGY